MSTAFNPANASPAAQIRGLLAGIPQQAAGERLGTVVIYVQGTPVTVDEPEWCIGHNNGTDHVTNLEDFSHIGESVELPVPQPDGTSMGGLQVCLAQWPFAAPGDNRKPYLSVEDDGTGRATALNSVGGLGFADRLRAYAGAVEATARQLAVHEAADTNDASFANLTAATPATVALQAEIDTDADTGEAWLIADTGTGWEETTPERLLADIRTARKQLEQAEKLAAAFAAGGLGQRHGGQA